MRVLIDIDSIVTDTLKSWLQVLNKKYGTNATEADINDWDMTKSPKLSHLTSAQVLDVLNLPGFYYNLELIPGARENIEALNKIHEVYFVTARWGATAHVETLRWFKETFPFLKSSQLIWCDKKELIEGDIIIDDKPETLGNFWLKHVNSVYLTIEYEYNKMFWSPRHSVNKNPKKKGVTPWSRLYKLIEKIDKPENRLKYRMAKNVVMAKAIQSAAKDQAQKEAK